MPRIVVFTPRQIRRHEDAFARRVGDALAAVAGEVAASIQSSVLVAATAPPSPTPVPPPVGPPAGIGLESLTVITSLWAGQVSATLAPAVAESYADAAGETLELLASAFPETVLPAVSDTFAEVYLARAANRLAGIGDHLWEEARASLLVGFAEGESIPELADRVRVAANVSQARASAIARTEIISASNAGAEQQVHVAGLVGTKEWLATNDDRTRCTHRHAEGQTVDVDGQFTLGGELDCGDFAVAHLAFPGDPTAPADERINCRCSVAYDLDVPPPTASTGPLVAAAEVHTGAMIALRMTDVDADMLAVRDFEPPDQLHVTILYLGEAADLTNDEVDGIFATVSEVATRFEPFSTEAFALNIFNPHSTERDTAVVLGLQGNDTPLEPIAHAIQTSAALESFAAMQHAPWVPHITLGYTDDLAAALEWRDRLGPISFDRIRIALASEVIDVPLGRSESPIVAASSNWNPAEHPRDYEGKFTNTGVGLPGFSLDFASLKKVGGQQGSNLGGVYEAPDGTRYYVKAQKSAKHAQNEVLASKLYRAAGVDVPEVVEGKGTPGLGGSSHTATKLVPGAKSDLAVKLGNKAYVAEIRDNFAIDAWLANWDVAGANFDNIITDGDGKPVRVDVGGALEFRAQGGVKGAAFGNNANEWTTLRDLSTAPQAAQIFGGMTDDELIKSAKRLEKVTPEKIDQLVESKPLAAKLKDRRLFILNAASKLKSSAVSDDVSAIAPAYGEGGLTKPTGKSVKKLTNAIIYGKYGDGDVIAESDDGAYIVQYNAASNKIMINGKLHGKQEAYQKLKGKENWTLSGDDTSGGNIAPPTLAPAAVAPTPPASTVVTTAGPKKIPTLKSAFNEVAGNGPLYDNHVIIEAKSVKTGKVLERYIAHNDPSIGASISFELWSDSKQDWIHVTSYTSEKSWHKGVDDLMYSPFSVELVQPHPVSAPSVSAPTSIIPTSVGIDALPYNTKQDIKKAFADADVKWWTNSQLMYPAAQDASTKYGITMSQVLAIMDETTKTKTSPTPFSDKIKKYLATEKGKKHVYQHLGVTGTNNKISSGTSNATSKPPTTSQTVRFVDSPSQLKTANYQVLGVSGANKMKEEMDAQHGAWTPSQRSALSTYTGNSYQMMNGCLRKPPTCNAAAIKLNENARAGMRPTTRDIRVARTTNFSAFGIIPKNGSYGVTSSEDLARLQSLVGKTLEEPGFLSTSVNDESKWSGSVRLRIDVPAGTRGAWVKPISQHPSENEFLLDAGLRYRIKEVIMPNQAAGIYKPIVVMEVVPE